MKVRIKKEKALTGTELALVIFCKLKNIKPNEVNESVVNDFVELLKEIEKENKENGN